MLDNTDIEIDICSIEYNEAKKVWEIQCWWNEADDAVNTEYREIDNGRFAVVGTISKDGEDVEWNDNFEEVIFDSCFWDDIEREQRRIKDEFNNN